MRNYQLLAAAFPLLITVGFHDASSLQRHTMLQFMLYTGL